MGKAINDATKQKIGDIYQYYVALLDCFSMGDEDTLYIESFGDVSILGIHDNHGMQKEIKHHLNKKTLSNRDSEFWNTIDNWCKEWDRIKRFDRLVFYTTAVLPSKSVFLKWENMSPDERFDLLFRCGQETKPRESKFRKHYNSVFNSLLIDQATVKQLLGKVEIQTSQSIISGMDKAFSPYTRLIPVNNRRRFIETLLGWIMSKVVNPPYQWKVNRSEFDELFTEATALYAKSNEVSLLQYKTDEVPTDEEINYMGDKTFVEEIRRIQYDQVIPEAMIDYWRTHSRIILNAQNDLLFTSSLPGYRESLLRRISATKRKLKRNATDKDNQERDRISQDMYDEITAWPANDFGHVKGNEVFFQNGIIHGIVDDKDFVWKMETEQ